MKTRRLTKKGPIVSALGLGLMGMSEFYGESDDEESIRTIHHAIERGVTLFDTADTYGHGHNEELLGRAIRRWDGRREDIVIATKFGIQRATGSYERTINGRPEYVHQACTDSLKRLGVDTIDLYYQHRVDPNVPIEETVGAMSQLVQEGKVRYLGLSEAAPATIGRAHGVHPITALQTEYSLWTRDVEKEILPLICDLDIGLVPYSPLGRGFLAGAVQQTEDLSENDFRRISPRFQGENFDRNTELLQQLMRLAADKNTSPGQIAIAWLMSRSENIVPIPGTRKIHRLDENIGALEVGLSGKELSDLDGLFDSTNVAGDRYPEAGMKGVNG